MDELKRMRRGQLIETICQLRQELDEKEEALVGCRKQLSEKRTLDEQNALTEAMKNELRTAVDDLRTDVSQPMRAQIEALQAERDALKAKLEEQNAAWTNAGTLAEAVVGVNGLLEDAQRAADQYLSNVRESERAAAGIIENAQAEAKRIVKAAEEQADALKAQSQHECDERMKTFRETCRALLEQQEALRSLLDGNGQK